MFRAYGSMPSCGVVGDATPILRSPLDAVPWVSPLATSTTATTIVSAITTTRDFQFSSTNGGRSKNALARSNNCRSTESDDTNSQNSYRVISENNIFKEDTVKGFLNCNSNTLQSLAQLHGKPYFQGLDDHISEETGGFVDGTNLPLNSPARSSPHSQGSEVTERYSRKVFVGGLPPDIDEDEITTSFRRFGPLVVDWPHKAESKSYFPPKGYAFLLFQDESSVQQLIEACITDEEKLYLCVSSPTIKDKPVQIRPWRLADADFVLDASMPLDPRKTVFVGGVPRPLKAVELAMIMDRLYGGVCYAGIDTDPELKYPKIRFIVSDTAAHIVNTWGTTTQNLTHVLNAMSMVGIPPRSAPQSTDYSVIHGLRAAIEAIAEPTDIQKDLMKQPKAEEEKFQNKGRVICITSARDNASMKSLEDIFHTVLLQQNTLAATHSELLPIDHCHLVIINMIPMHIESLVSNRAQQEISPALSSEIHSVCAADISNKLTHLILPHYDLASTTVTGIPMKEEQNASSSANYDVEIFHAKQAHTVIFGSELILPTSIKEGAKYETVTLKWCTPRGCGASDLQPCLAQYRVTPVDVTSRPSSCLINFLLNGRSVLLEMPRKTGGKLTSHLLSAHGGEIFIHTLHISRSCLEDPPSISEGGGGRVTDYRIADFGNFIQTHKLVPLKPIPEHPFDENLQKARMKLYRRSRYFPLTLGMTLVYNVRQYLDPLLNVIGKEELSENDIIACRQVIFNLVSLSSRSEQLPLPNMGHRLKGNKKEEQYKLLWTELEILIQSQGTSAGHKAVLQCLRDCRSRGPDTAEKVELDQAVRELDSMAESTHRTSVIRATTDSPMSPPRDAPYTKTRKVFGNTGNSSLLDIVTASERSQNQKRIEFSGRLCTPPGQIAKLYPNIGLKENTIREADPK